MEKGRKESEKNSQSLESGEPSSITDKLESLLKSIKNFDNSSYRLGQSPLIYFSFFRKAFQIKSVPDELKSRNSIKYIRERVNNLLTYFKKLVVSGREHVVYFRDAKRGNFSPLPSQKPPDPPDSNMDTGIAPITDREKCDRMSILEEQSKPQLDQLNF
ncbi:hypothetical protein TNCV_1306541 [Trichonephila clavipes]|nr:hypothetical protein TNCV_1306541 [Trichonephila clavipes]